MTARPRVSEDGFQDAVIELARTVGWRVAHFRPARTNKGYRTPVSADGAGFPDLVMVRDLVLFVELKADDGDMSDAQVAWRDALVRAGGHAFVWAPSDWDEIEQILTRQRGR